MTSDPTALAADAASAIRDRAGIPGLDIALVLGSGWSAAAHALGEPVADIALHDLPGFSAPVVEGHGGSLVVARDDQGRHLGVFTGRTHFYEGRGVDAVVHGVRTAAAAGATTVVLTNGCGGLHLTWAPGTPVLISDHINLTGSTPLRGAQFIDMSDVYSARLRASIRAAVPGLDEGVYVQFSGPQYETPAEVRMAARIGGDLVGMSTALEATAARALGLEIVGISLVTNPAAGVSEEPLDHAEVLAAGKEAAPRLVDLLRRVLSVI